MALSSNTLLHITGNLVVWFDLFHFHQNIVVIIFKGRVKCCLKCVQFIWKWIGLDVAKFQVLLGRWQSKTRHSASSSDVCDIYRCLLACRCRSCEEARHGGIHFSRSRQIRSPSLLQIGADADTGFPTQRSFLLSGTAPICLITALPDTKKC